MNLFEALIMSFICGIAGGAVFYLLQSLSKVLQPKQKGRVIKMSDRQNPEQAKGRVIKKSKKSRWAEQNPEVVNPEG